MAKRQYLPGLAGWLAAVTTVLVTAAVAAISVFGMRLLHDLAVAEALTRVELGASSAREALRQQHEDLHTSATLLAARPTLSRLLAGQDGSLLDAYLEQYCEDALLDACAIARNGVVVRQNAAVPDWQLVIEVAAVQGDRFVMGATNDSAPLMVASAPVSGLSATRVLAVRRLDGNKAAMLGERTGLDTRVISRREPAAGDPFADLLLAAALRDGPTAQRVGGLNGYAAALPLVVASGDPEIFLLTFLPEADVMAPVASLELRMQVVAALVALTAIAGGLLIGRYWIGGIRRLTESARRIGGGDLAAAIPTEAGAEIGVLATTMEEMRRNLLELTEEIRRREAQAQAVLGGIVEGVFAVDRKRRFRFLNTQGERLLSISNAAAFGRFCGDVLNPAPDPQGRRPCDIDCPIIRARIEGSAETVERITPGGGPLRRVVIVSAAASDNVQVQVLRDETELEAARRTRDTVLANISHEFRTPLAAQLASIELLRDGIDDMSPGARRQLVSSLERGLQRLTLLIDNLLESVRIESGQLAIRRHELRIEEVVARARELVEPLILQRGQQLRIEPMSGMANIRGDRERLVQVVVNLLANASKFAPTASTVRVGGEAAERGGVVLWVEDEGPGPANADDDLIFEPFRRSSAEDPEESGLGLGLFIVKSIVERHGGKVRLMRTATARTRACIELPEISTT